MDERRKSKRTEMSSKIMINRLDGGENRRQETAIDIVDVSKKGLGFECTEELRIGEIYEAYLTIWTKEVLHAVLQIVRIERHPDRNSYGAVFIGMSETDQARITTYQTVSEWEG